MGDRKPNSIALPFVSESFKVNDDSFRVGLKQRFSADPTKGAKIKFQFQVKLSHVQDGDR